jgi:hypothetical protein
LKNKLALHERQFIVLWLPKGVVIFLVEFRNHLRVVRAEVSGAKILEEIIRVILIEMPHHVGKGG